MGKYYEQAVVIRNKIKKGDHGCAMPHGYMEASVDLLIEAELEALAIAVEHNTREQDKAIIRHSCHMCSGTGYGEAISHPIYDQGVQVGENIEYTECEYCGRPIQAIVLFERPKGHKVTVVSDGKMW